MRNRDGGDASLLLGIVLGAAVGAAITIILRPKEEHDVGQRLSEEAKQAEQALEAKKKEIQEELGKLRADMPREKSPEQKAQEEVAKAKDEVQKAQEQAAKSHEQVQAAEEKLAETKQEAASTYEGRSRDTQDAGKQ